MVPQQHVPEDPIVSLTITRENYSLCAEPLLKGSKCKHENVYHSLDLEVDPNKTGPSSRSNLFFNMNTFEEDLKALKRVGPFSRIHSTVGNLESFATV